MAIPTNGVVFYAPLAEDKATAETGQTITSNDAIYTESNGIPCFYSNATSYLRVDDFSDFMTAYNSGNFSISFWGQAYGESFRSMLTFFRFWKRIYI